MSNIKNYYTNDSTNDSTKANYQSNNESNKSPPLEQLVGIAVDILKQYSSNKNNSNFSNDTVVAEDPNVNNESNKSPPLEQLVGIAVDILKKTTENDNVPLDKLIGIAVDILKKKTENDNVPLDKLIGIAVDILKKTTEKDNLPLDKLVGIAVDILKKTMEKDNLPLEQLIGIAVEILKKTTEKGLDKGFKGYLKPFNSGYTLPTMTVRLKDIKFFRTDTNYYDSEGKPIEPKPEQQPETGDADDKGEVAIIKPVYDGTNIKIIAYKISDSENPITLTDIAAADLNNPEKIKEIINSVMPYIESNYAKEIKDKLNNLLNNLAKEISILENNVSGVNNDLEENSAN